MKAFVVIILCISVCYACKENRTDNTLLCDGCNFLVGEVEDWLSTNSTMVAIEQKLEKLCNLIPKYSSTCCHIIDTGIPTIIKYLIEFQSPFIVCVELSLCFIPS